MVAWSRRSVQQCGRTAYVCGRTAVYLGGVAKTTTFKITVPILTWTDISCSVFQYKNQMAVCKRFLLGPPHLAGWQFSFWKRIVISNNWAPLSHKICQHENADQSCVIGTNDEDVGALSATIFFIQFLWKTHRDNFFIYNFYMGI